MLHTTLATERLCSDMHDASHATTVIMVVLMTINVDTGIIDAVDTVVVVAHVFGTEGDTWRVMGRWHG